MTLLETVRVAVWSPVGQIPWRKPPVLALAALPGGTALGRRDRVALSLALFVTQVSLTVP